MPAALVAGMSFGFPAEAAHPRRIAALEWASAETLIALAIAPVGVADIEGYRRWVVEPGLPAGTVDLGLRTEPNLELLRWLSPDLLTTVPGYASGSPWLERIAPILPFEIYTERGTPYESAV